MNYSFADGVADGMNDVALLKARSAANNADADLALARAEIEKKQSLLVRMNTQNRLLRAEGTGFAVVVSSMIKTMEEVLTPVEMERFRENLAKRARARMLELDGEERNTNKFVDIEATFARDDFNKVLRIF